MKAVPSLPGGGAMTARRASYGRSRVRSRGEVIRAVRLALRLPVQVLAENAGIPTATVTAYELGRKALTDTAEQKLVVALHVGLRRALRAGAVAEDAGLVKAAPRLRRAA